MTETSVNPKGSNVKIDGEKLRNLRIDKGYSQEKLAALSNVNRRTIQRAEASNAIAVETLSFIADALDVDISNLRASPSNIVETSGDPKMSETDIRVERHDSDHIWFFLACFNGLMFLWFYNSPIGYLTPGQALTFLLFVAGSGLACIITWIAVPKFRIKKLNDTAWETIAENLNRSEADALYNKLQNSSRSTQE